VKETRGQSVGNKRSDVFLRVVLERLRLLVTPFDSDKGWIRLPHASAIVSAGLSHPYGQRVRPHCYPCWAVSYRLMKERTATPIASVNSNVAALAGFIFG
jgi:hypothetical protein